MRIEVLHLLCVVSSFNVALAVQRRVALLLAREQYGVLRVASTCFLQTSLLDLLVEFLVELLNAFVGVGSLRQHLYSVVGSWISSHL